MKTVKFTDAELEAVRFAIAGAASSTPANLHLRTALAKLDGSVAEARLLEFVIIRGDGTQSLLFSGLARRWTPVHEATLRQARWLMGKADRVSVRIDGSEVDPVELGKNEAFT